MKILIFGFYAIREVGYLLLDLAHYISLALLLIHQGRATEALNRRLLLGAFSLLARAERARSARICLLCLRHESVARWYSI